MPRLSTLSSFCSGRTFTSRAGRMEKPYILSYMRSTVTSYMTPILHTVRHTVVHTGTVLHRSIRVQYSSSKWSWSSSFQCTLLYCPVQYGVLTVQCIWPHNDRYTIGLGLGLFVPASLPANGTLDPSTMPSIGFPRCGFQGCLA